MRINVSLLQSGVSANIGAVTRQGMKCVEQVSAIAAASFQSVLLNGAAYARLFGYLVNVKIPVMMQHAVYLDVLSQDMRADLRRLSELRMVVGDVADTDAMQRQIQELQNQNKLLKALEILFSGVMLNIPSWIFGRLQANNANTITSLTAKIDMTLNYANDSSIYSRSSGEAANLNAAMKALGAVVFDARTGSYDLSRVTDWSWRNKIASRYYQSKTDLNRLETYGISAGGTAFGGDPVNMSTGNYVFRKEYLMHGGPRELSFVPFYNSQAAVQIGSQADSAGDPPMDAAPWMGAGWTHCFHMKLVVEGGLVVVECGDGSSLIFISDGDELPEGEATGLPLGKRFECATLPGHAVVVMEENYRFETTDGRCVLFDKSGRPIREHDGRGEEVKYTYGPDGVLALVEGPGGANLSFEYRAIDGTRRLTCVHDEIGRRVRLAYDRGRLVRMTDELGNSYGFDYDDGGRLCHVQNPAGFESLRNFYDAENRVSEQVLADGSTLVYRYEDGNKVAMSDAGGIIASYDHDAGFRTTAIENSIGIERFGYNAEGKMASHTDANGALTTYDHDESGRLVRVTDALGCKTTIDRDSFGRVTRVSVEGVLQFENKYDDEGNIAEQVDALGHVTGFEYDENGRVISMTRPDGSKAEVVRDARGNVTSLVDFAGVRSSYDYDALGRMSAYIDSDGNKTSFSYDEKGHVISVGNPVGCTRSYEFDENGRVVSVVDFDGFEVRRAYDTMGNVVKAVGKDGSCVSFEYDSRHNMTARIDEAGFRTTYEYDSAGRCVSETDALGNVTLYEYDALGNRTAMVDALGGRREFEYDALGRPVRYRDEVGATTNVGYDEQGNVVRVVDALGGARAYEYDAAGRGIAVTDVLGNRTEYVRDALGNIIKETDASGRTRIYEYQIGGRLKRVRDFDGRCESFEYDGRGNVVKRTRGDGFAVAYDYDALNRVVALSASTGQVKRFEYDAVGNVSASIEANGAVTRYAYTPTGKLASVTDALGTRIVYEHDSRGDLVRINVWPAQGPDESRDGQALQPSASMCYERDALGRVVCVTDELGNEERFTYDALGRTTSMTDRDGLVTRYSYTPTGLLERVVYDDGRVLELRYDMLERLISMRDWLGETRIWRDVAGQIVKVRDHEGRVVAYELGKTGRRLGMTYPDGTSVSYAYDDALRLSSVRCGGFEARYSYDEAGRLAGRTFANGTGSRYTYDERGLLESLENYDRFGTIEECRFSYDAMGNRNRIERMRRADEMSSVVFDYEYDALGRLVASRQGGQLVRSYGYDGMGNRTYLWDEGAETRSAFNAANQLVFSEGACGRAEYAYDGRGNLVEERIDGEVAYQYQYDSANQLSAMFDANGFRASFSLNGLGYRVGTRLSVQPQADGEFVIDSADRAIEHVVDLTRRHHSDIQDIVDGKVCNFVSDSQVIGELADESVRYFLNDELGSPLLYVGESGEVLERYNYDEFGASQGFQHALQPFGFAGYRRNPFGSTLHAFAREYHPCAGRFASRDADRFRRPSIAISFNQYIYCFDSPIAFVDPDGHDCYIFYLPEWESLALNDRQSYAAYYGIDLSEVHLVPIRNNDDLTNGWNGMGVVDGKQVDIQAVSILCHANYQVLGYGDNSDDVFRADNIRNLEHKDIEELFLLGCNAGHLDHTGKNVASWFAEVVDEAPVIAADGTVYFYTNISGKPQTYEPVGDEHFLEQCFRERDAEGWHVYRYENGRLVVSESLGFEHSVTGLLNFCPA